MRQLLTGLHYCHINQVLHRDIKGFYSTFEYFFTVFSIIVTYQACLT